MRPSGYQKANKEDPETLQLSSVSQSNNNSKKMQEPMDRFRRYEENFLNSSKIVNRGLKQLDAAKGHVDTVISTSVEVESELNEAEAYLKAMTVECNNMIVADKKLAQQKVNEYKDEFKQLTQNFEGSKKRAEEEALKGGSAARTKLVAANMKLDESTRLLENSRMLVADSEQIGSKTMDEMRTQREILEGAKSNVQDTKNFTVDAKGVLKDIARRALIHKIICLFIILVLLILIGVTVYYGIYKKNEDKD